MTAGAPARPVGIGAVATYTGDRFVAVAELAEQEPLGRAERDFAAACGIRTVSVLAGATASGLAARVSRALLDTGVAEPDVLLVLSPRAPEVLLGSEACAVQAAAGLDAALTLGLDGLGCVASSAAWGLGRDLLLADAGRRGVLVAYASLPAVPGRVRHPVTVIGDGAFAMTLVPGGRPVLLAHRMESDGRFHDLFRIDYRQAPAYEWVEECASPDRYRFELALHSRLRIRRLVDLVLGDAGVALGDVRATLMQNVSAGAYDFYESALGVTIHPVCRRHLERHGHLGAMDVVLNLHELVRGGELADGDLVLVLNNSPVAAWAVTLWQT